MPSASFESVTGRLGIGAIAFLGLFLVVDGLQVGVFELIETYVKTSTWSVVGVIPTAVVIYIVGVFCLGFAELSLSRFPAFHGPSPHDVIAVSRDGGALLQQIYADHVRNHELLKGASVSFVILAVGTIADWRNIPGYEVVVVLAAMGAVALSVLSLVFARRAARQAADLAGGVRSPDAA
jgi:hypothetical protein